MPREKPAHPVFRAHEGATTAPFHAHSNGAPGALLGSSATPAVGFASGDAATAMDGAALTAPPRPRARRVVMDSDDEDDHTALHAGMADADVVDLASDGTDSEDERIMETLQPSSDEEGDATAAVRVNQRPAPRAGPTASYFHVVFATVRVHIFSSLIVSDLPADDDDGMLLCQWSVGRSAEPLTDPQKRHNTSLPEQLTAALSTPGTCVIAEKSHENESVVFCSLPHGAHGVRVVGGPSRTLLRASSSFMAALCRLVRNDMVRMRAVAPAAGSRRACRIQVWLRYKTCLAPPAATANEGLPFGPVSSLKEPMRSLGVLLRSRLVVDDGTPLAHVYRSAFQVTPEIPSAWDAEEAALIRGEGDAGAVGASVQVQEQDLYAAARPLPGQLQAQPDLAPTSAWATGTHSLLRATLRSYQRRAVRWMAERERAACEQLTAPIVVLHPCWGVLRSLDGQQLHVCPTSGALMLNPPTPPALSQRACFGGILADAMGLGKTVSTLGLIAATHATASLTTLCEVAPIALHPSLLLKRAHALALRVRVPRALADAELVDTDGGSEGTSSSSSSSMVLRVRLATRPAAASVAPAAPAAGKRRRPTSSEDDDSEMSFRVDEDADGIGLRARRARKAAAAIPTSPPREAVCVCGIPFEAALPLDVQMAISMYGATHMTSVRNGKKVLKPITAARDPLPWVSCTICGEWQHAMCSQRVRDLHSCVDVTLPGAPRIGAAGDDVLNAVVCFTCQSALLAGGVIASKATIIITPVAIESQWSAEMARHLRLDGVDGIRPLKVVHFAGVHATLAALQAAATRAAREVRSSSRVRSRTSAWDEDDDDDDDDDEMEPAPAARASSSRSRAVDGPSAAELVASLSPFGLAGADIVLTTYTALQNDIHYASNASTDFVSVAAYIATQVRETASIHAEADLIERLFAFLRDGCLPHGADVTHALQSGRAMRYEKRFRIVPTPLVSVYFLRAVLDEAQMIDAPAANAATMARQLNSLYRWCVSGTPFAKSAADLQALLLFLDWQPYAREDIMLRSIMDSASAGSIASLEHLLCVTHDIMWRCSVDEVSDELDLPPLTQETLTLHMAPIEEAYYRHESSEQVDALQPVITRWRREEHEAAAVADARTAASADVLLFTGAQMLSQRERTTVLHPLVRLRQACVHPQLASASVRRRGKRGAGAGSKSRSSKQNEVVPMDAVLDELIQTALNKCEDDQRTIVSSLNGMAGLLWLADDRIGAQQCYEQVRKIVERAHGASESVPSTGLSSAVTDASRVRVDPFLRIHAFRNYAALLRSEAVAPSATRDAFIASLDRAAEKLEAEDLAAAVAVVHNKFLAMEKSGQAVQTEMRAAGVRGVAWANDDAAAAGAAIPESSSRTVVATAALQRLHVNMTALEAPLDDLLCVAAGQLIAALPEDKRDIVLDAARGNFGHNDEDDDFVARAGQALVWNVPSMHTLKGKVAEALAELRNARAKALSCLTRLMQPSAADVAAYEDCKSCRVQYLRKGPACVFCSTIQTSLTAYRRQFRVSRGMNMDAEHHDKYLEMDLDAIVTTKRRKKKTKKRRAAPGAAGDLQAYLKEQGLEEVGGDGSAHLSDEEEVEMSPEEKAAAALAKQEQEVELAAAGRGHNEEPTALVRALRAMGRAARVVLNLPAALRGAASSDDAAVVYVDTVVSKVLDALSAEADALITLKDARVEVLAFAQELADATLRMQLALPDEELTPQTALFRVHKAAIPARVLELRATEAAASHDLQTHVGALQYLLNIRHEEETAAAAPLQQAQPAAANVECIVCRDTLGGASGLVAVLECGHRFCFSHVADMKRATLVPEYWGRAELKCPSCRAEFAEADVRKATVAPPAAKPVQESSRPQLLRVKASKGTAGVLPEVAAVRVSGAYGTKIDYLVRCLRCLQAEGTRPALTLFSSATVDSTHATLASASSSPVQSIVFSQWDAALAICEAALQRNGISCVRAAGAKSVSSAVAKFTQDASVNVLLLPFKAGAAGLNITCAQHVFLLEPLLDPALEQQAIGRVYRMGQSRRTYVHRLIAADTVEPVIAEMNASRVLSRVEGTTCTAAPVQMEDDDGNAYERRALQALAHTIASRGQAEDVSTQHHGGAAEDHVVTRGDILSLVSRERAYADLISRLGSSVLDTSGAAASSSSGGGAASPDPAGPQPSEADPEAAEAARALERARRNHAFWTQFVTAAPYGANRMIRQVALEAIRAQSPPEAAASSDRVDVFGRLLSPAVAARLLQLPEDRNCSGGGGPPRPPALTASIQVEIERLLAVLAAA